MGLSNNPGRVYLVGAGPGDPKLLTIRGAELLGRADVVVYDRLVHKAILRHARSDAKMIYAGKAASRHTMKQEEINQLLVDLATQGQTVVRLKGGDPFVFGRGGEEAETLADAGISFEIVSGITSAIAVPAYAGIPVTHRKLCSTLGIITGHEDPDKAESSIRWDLISTGVDTLVFLMGVENLPNIVSQLIANGRVAETPVAIIRWGTRADQETLVGTLGDIVEKVCATDFKSPAVTVVGEVVKLRDKLQWFENRPLLGKRIVVTRSREQASELSGKLLELGADVIEFPVIKIVPPEDTLSLDSAIHRIGEFDWIIFTSTNGVERFVMRLLEMDHDVRAMAGAKLAAIGPGTAEALRKINLKVDYVPSEFVAEAVLREFPEDVFGKRILIPRAKEAREVLPEKLKSLGADVCVAVAYETKMEASDASEIREKLDAGQIDAVTFTSSSTVRNFAALVGQDGGISLSEDVTVACIGPITAQTAVELGMQPDVVADEYTIDGLVKAILRKHEAVG